MSERHIPAADLQIDWSPRGDGPALESARIGSSDPPFLPYAKQVVDDADRAAVVAALESDFLTSGPAVEGFEAAFAQQTTADHVVACSSGTAALHLASLCCGLGPGDLAIVPAITFAATANAVRLTGAHPVFADIDPRTGLMSAEHVDVAAKGLPAERIKAIFPVHFAGQAAPVEAIQQVAGGLGARVVEDAAHAIGTTYTDSEANTWPVGAARHSDMAVFSFHPVKTIAMGEGGAITTNSEWMGETVRDLRTHGIVRDTGRLRDRSLSFDDEKEAFPWANEMQALGLNYRASDLHCALGHSQLAKLNGFVEKRASLSRHYRALLQDRLPFVTPLQEVSGQNPAWHLFVVRIDFKGLSIRRADVMRALKARGIGTQVHYLPVYRHPYYRACYGDQSLAGAERYYASCLSLPLWPGMGEKDVERVVDALERCLPA
ncbi:MAG: UDP-4-amino-4,6-dideoxy-N-acetyl-beta-L-altrosamine transaminase [Pseudomonadota bacterium]